MMDVAAAVISALQVKRFNNCPHEEWVEPQNPEAFNPPPKSGDLQCTGCGVLATEEARKNLKR